MKVILSFNHINQSSQIDDGRVKRPLGLGFQNIKEILEIRRIKISELYSIEKENYEFELASRNNQNSMNIYNYNFSSKNILENKVTKHNIIILENKFFK